MNTRTRANTIHQRALERAAEILGGTEALRRHLKVRPSRLDAWLRGIEPLPDHFFLRVVDLLSEDKEQDKDKDKAVPDQGAPAA